MNFYGASEYPRIRAYLRGVQNPPEIFTFFWKSEGKEVERKREGMGGGLIVNIILGSEIFLSGEIFGG